MAIAVFFIVLDRFLKLLAANNFFSPPVNIVRDILKFNFAGNFNIAFSLPAGGGWLVAAIFLVIIFVFIFFVYCWRRRDIRAFYLFFIILGAASNLFDRLRFGYVIDYLDVKYFTIFNLADAMIVAGAIGFILASRRGLTEIEK